MTIAPTLPSYSNRHNRPTWDNLIQPLNELIDKLNRTWSPVGHLHGVADTEALCEPQSVHCNVVRISYRTWTKSINVRRLSSNC
ncbi:MAG: hypothetical protein R3E08_14160 [Thiotrichaceae bacterium]